MTSIRYGDIRDAARSEVQKRWDATACGPVSAGKGTIGYFELVEGSRYQQQRWMYDYYGFERFNGKTVLETGVGP